MNMAFVANMAQNNQSINKFYVHFMTFCSWMLELRGYDITGHYNYTILIQHIYVSFNAFYLMKTAFSKAKQDCIRHCCCIESM